MFHVKIEQDEDGWFIATVPALPGCVSDGRSREEALYNVQDAMFGWLSALDHTALEKLSEEEKKDLAITEPKLQPHLDLPTVQTVAA